MLIRTFILTSLACWLTWISVWADELPDRRKRDFASNQVEANPASEDDVQHDALFPKLDLPGLPNSIRVTPQLISGGQPEAADGFHSLKQLGIRTIISVDGIRPDVASAKANGMRYIHLPIGYRGISQERIAEFAWCLQNLQGPIYVHCHHGRHRSPAASAVACLSIGKLNHDQAERLLTVAQTNPAYVGLFDAVRNAHPVAGDILPGNAPELPETAEVSDLVECMIDLEDSVSTLEQLLQNNQKKPARRALIAQATLIHDSFTELQRGSHDLLSDADFEKSLNRSLAISLRLKKQLKGNSLSPVRLRSVVSQIRTECQTCHQSHRDRPIQ